MEGKKSIVFYSAWADLAEDLPAEAAGELLHMIIAYAFRGEEPKCDNPILNAVFSMVRKKLDEDNNKYQEKVDRMKAIRTDNRQKSDSNQTVICQKSDSNLSENCSDTVTDTVTVTVTDTVTDTKSPTETKKKSKKEKAAPTLSVEQMQDIVLQSELGCQVQDKVRDWIEYKHQRNEPYKDMGFKSLITQISKHEREAGADAVCDLIDLCMSNEWKGIIWEKLQRSARADPGGKVDWDRV